MADKTFNVKITMEERWVDDFCSMLYYMQYCGEVGHSSAIGFYSDGDGDFRPKFEFDTEFNKTEGFWYDEDRKLPELEVMFDAG